MKIAIIGSGIAGLTCAWRLAGHHQIRNKIVPGTKHLPNFNHSGFALL